MCDRTDCYLVSCEVLWFSVGELVAVLYVLYMFGTTTVVGEPPRHMCDVECRWVPVRMDQGRLYVADYRVHHWMLHAALLPLAFILHLYWLLGGCVIMILHGLSYTDRFEFVLPPIATESHVQFKVTNTDDDEDLTSVEL